jgi:hypothetical protein
MGETGFKTISSQMSEWLERGVSLDEVKQAVWECDGSKAPGPDGFKFTFYKKSWHLIRNEPLIMVVEIYCLKLLTCCLKTSSAHVLFLFLLE